MIRALISGEIAFMLSVAVGWPIVHYLRSQRAGKFVSEDQPESHQAKMGTPTFGGFIIWLPAFVVTAFAVDWIEHKSILLPMGIVAATGTVGFIDDLGTLQHQRFRFLPQGLSWRFKIAFTTLLAIGAAWVLYDQLDVQSINIPWSGQYELGLWYIPIAILIIVATTSAVAVTDGLDALAGGTTLFAFVAYGVIAFVQGQDFVATFALVIAGSNLGFLWYNAHPAMVFMGDTGALALGASLAVVALMTGHWFLLPVIGFVFVAVAVSNILQIGYFKISGGKRLFRRAPLHHHFEELGWAESQVVTRFWVVSIAAAMIGVAFALAVPA